MIVGISFDNLDAQQKFVEKNTLPFALLCDTKGEVAKAYGAKGAKFAARHTFVIDKKGVLRKAYTTVSPANHPKEVLKFVKEELSK